MTPAVRLVAASLLGVCGVWLIASGVAERRPPLHRVVARLQRIPGSPSRPDGLAWARVGRVVLGRRSFPAGVLADLRIVQRPAEAHAAMIVAASAAGLFGPVLLVAVAQGAGAASLTFALPLLVAVGAAVTAPVVFHASMRTRAGQIRQDLRHQLSAYLDVVTMLLAGNVGNEGALRQAALAGDGRLFVELRQRILVAETANRSLVSALARLGDDLDLIEVQQIAASASLGATAGAPVARSLNAKCSTLRSALASEQEAEARVRTGKITVPLVGMSLLIMAAVIYPALNL